MIGAPLRPPLSGKFSAVVCRRAKSREPAILQQGWRAPVLWASVLTNAHFQPGHFTVRLSPSLSHRQTRDDWRQPWFSRLWPARCITYDFECESWGRFSKTPLVQTHQCIKMRPVCKRRPLCLAPPGPFFQEPHQQDLVTDKCLMREGVPTPTTLCIAPNALADTEREVNTLRLRVRST